MHRLRIGDDIESVRVEGAAPLPSDDDLPETIVVEGEDGPQEVPNPVYQAMQALAHLLERKVVV